MADAPGNLGWTGVRLWETTDPVLGGDETAVSNVPLNQLASRDLFLRSEIDEIKSALASQTNGGRLSISATNPTPTAFRQNSRIVYWLPYASSSVALWTGTIWEIYAIPSGGLQLSTAAWAAPQTRDVFVYWDGVSQSLNLETRTWANWRLLSERGYNLELFQGVWVLGSDRTRRYLGTVFNSPQSTLAQTGIHDDENITDLWNVNNQVEKTIGYVTDSSLFQVGYQTPRIAKGDGSATFDFFRLVTGLPNEIVEIHGISQNVNLTSAYYHLTWEGFDDRVASATTPKVFGVPQLTASDAYGIVRTTAIFRSRGTQVMYLLDARGVSGANPNVQIVRALAKWRY